MRINVSLNPILLAAIMLSCASSARAQVVVYGAGYPTIGWGRPAMSYGPWGYSGQRSTLGSVGPAPVTWYHVGGGYTAALQNGLPWQRPGVGSRYMDAQQPVGPDAAVARYSRVAPRQYYARSYNDPRSMNRGEGIATRPVPSNYVNRQRVIRTPETADPATTAVADKESTNQPKNSLEKPSEPSSPAADTQKTTLPASVKEPLPPTKPVP